MMKRILITLSILLTSAAVVFPATTSAFNTYQADCSGKAAKSTVCSDPASSSGNPLAGPDGVLLKITNIVAYIAGAVAIIMILVSSIRFITSGSDISTNTRTDDDVEKAKNTIAGALIGLAIIILAKVIISYVVRRL